jgi:tRNA dimethylallyltransferase
MARPFLTVIAGPTASGKSTLALELAKRLGAEIVSADSQQIYRHFDIGTAKPTAAELAAVPHHLVSAIDPDEPFSAARFQQLADEAIAGIAGRGRRVLVVGGTGLYLRILLHGVAPAPRAAPELRRALEQEAREIGRPALHRRLAEVDPETAAAVKPSDLVRIVRALEIHALTGTAASRFRREHRFAEDRYPHRLFVLDPPRAELYRAIDERTRRMFAEGLVDEVRRLVALGYREAAPMRSVGYAQALAHLDRTLTLEQAIQRAARETRRYAKRQLTWFRREPGARFVQPPWDVEALRSAAESRDP